MNQPPNPLPAKYVHGMTRELRNLYYDFSCSLRHFHEYSINDDPRIIQLHDALVAATNYGILRSLPITDKGPMLDIGKWGKPPDDYEFKSLRGTALDHHLMKLKEEK